MPVRATLHGQHESVNEQAKACPYTQQSDTAEHVCNMFASSLLNICSAATSCTRQITFGCVVLLANEKMRRYESGAAKRKKLTAAKTEIAKLTKLDSFFQASESSSLDTCTSVTSTQNQTA